MATDYTVSEAQQRRARYNREIWSGGIAFLLLLVLLMFAMLHPALREFEPFLGLAIVLIAVALGCRLILVSHRDAQLAQYGIQPEKAAAPSFGWQAFSAIAVFACIAAVIIGSLSPSPAVGGASISTAVIIITGPQLFRKIFEQYSDEIQDIFKKLKDRIRQYTGMDREN